MDTLNNNEGGDNTWLTQKNIAERWHVSQGTIIKWREDGKLPFFRLPGTSKILYPLREIILLETQHTTEMKEYNAKRQKQSTELQRKKPAMSAKPQKEWRI